MVAGILYQRFMNKKGGVYLSLLPAMLAGRVVWGVAHIILYALGKSEFGWAVFMAGAFLNAIPGIILQVALIPIVVAALKNYTLKKS